MLASSPIFTKPILDGLIVLAVWLSVWTWVSVIMIRAAVLKNRSATLWLWLGIVTFYLTWFIVMFIGGCFVAFALHGFAQEVRLFVMLFGGLIGFGAAFASVVLLRNRLERLPSK
jgi:hypothetical protein